MGANVELVVQAAPPGALELAEAEDADDVVEQLAERLAQSGHADVSLIREQRSHEPGASGSLTIPEVFEAVVRAASGAEGGQVRCFVASNAVRDRLRGHLGGATGRLRRFRCQAWTVVLRAGDITSVVADAVVNASNTSLKLGGGVSGALRRAAGPGLQAEMSALGGLPPGGLAVTGAHGLKTTSRILHVATASGRLADVRGAIEKVLGYCQEQQLRSVAVPALGTGTGALDAATAASQFAEAVDARPPSDRPCELVVVVWGEATFAAFEQAFTRAPGFAPPG